MPRRVPTPTKELSGTLRANPHATPAPKAAKAALPPPASLSPGAREEWLRLAPMLAATGTVIPADAMALERLCEVWSDVRMLRAALAAHGSTYPALTREGNTVHRARPEVAMLADADRRLLAYLTRFGLTPADRGRVAPGEPEAEADPWDALAAGPRQN